MYKNISNKIACSVILSDDRLLTNKYTNYKRFLIGLAFNIWLFLHSYHTCVIQ
jgi:hypothetical protein